MSKTYLVAGALALSMAGGAVWIGRGAATLPASLSIAAEAQEERGVARELRAQDLHRDIATEPGVVARVDLRHAAAADELPDLVSAGQQAGRLGHLPTVPSALDSRVDAGIGTDDPASPPVCPSDESPCI